MDHLEDLAHHTACLALSKRKPGRSSQAVQQPLCRQRPFLLPRVSKGEIGRNLIMLLARCSMRAVLRVSLYPNPWQIQDSPYERRGTYALLARMSSIFSGDTL